MGAALLSERERLGKRFHEGGCTSCPWTTVVGVVSEVKYAGLDKPDEGTVYTPLSGPDGTSGSSSCATNGDPAGVVPSVRQRIRELDPGAAASPTSRPMDELVAQSLGRPRSLSMLVGGLRAVGAGALGRSASTA